MNIMNLDFRRLGLSFSIFLFIFFIINNFSFSQTLSDLQKQIINRNNQIDILQKEIDNYTQKVAHSHEEAKTLKELINNLETRKVNLKNQISLTNLQIEKVKSNLFFTEDRIGQDEDGIRRDREALAKILMKINILNQNDNLLLNLLSPENKNLTEGLNEAIMLSELNHAINQQIAKIKIKVEELNKDKEEFKRQKNHLANLSVNLSGQKILVEQNRKEKQTIWTQTKNQEKKYQQIIDERQKKILAIKLEISNFESQIKYFLDRSKLPKPGSAPLSWPLAKIFISQYFGHTDFSRSGAYNGYGHNGLDLVATVGTPIYAVADGIVIGIGDTDTACFRVSYGKWILIKHNNGLATLYAHLSLIQVSQNQKISTEQQIALSGNSGYSTGPHLHFTVIAGDAVKIFGPTEYKSKVCGTYLVMPYAPLNAYLNPMDYLNER